MDLDFLYGVNRSPQLAMLNIFIKIQSTVNKIQSALSKFVFSISSIRVDILIGHTAFNTSVISYFFFNQAKHFRVHANRRTKASAKNRPDDH